jgi:predicted GIY-YIG superfamily endonuclease
MGKIGTIDCEGKTGTIYTFNMWTIDTSFNEVECVYIYSKKLADDSWKSIYVGQTEHLATRLKEHEDEDNKSDICIQNSGATHIFVHREKSKFTRIAIETDIRNNPDYNWSCNKQ